MKATTEDNTLANTDVTTEVENDKPIGDEEDITDDDEQSVDEDQPDSEESEEESNEPEDDLEGPSESEGKDNV